MTEKSDISSRPSDRTGYLRLNTELYRAGRFRLGRALLFSSGGHILLAGLLIAGAWFDKPSQRKFEISDNTTDKLSIKVGLKQPVPPPGERSSPPGFSPAPDI